MSNGVSSRSMIKAGLGFAVIGLSVSGVGAPAALAISLAYAALDGSGEIDRELDRWGVAR